MCLPKVKVVAKFEDDYVKSVPNMFIAHISDLLLRCTTVEFGYFMLFLN